MDIETQKDILTKDNKPLQGIYKNYVRLSEKDKILTSYISEKSSRLAAALLLITTRNKGHDPLISEIEQSSVRLVVYASQTHASDTAREQFLTEFGTLATLLDVGGRSGRIAPSNAELLTQELLAFQKYVGDIEWSRGRSFVEGVQLTVMQPKDMEVKDTYVSDTQPHYRQAKDAYHPEIPVKETEVYESQVQGIKDIRPTPPRHNNERMQDAQKDRRATILGMLQRKDRVSVRDVANVIKDCSEKTLQRELLALVAQGVLVKEGERRWSTYRLA